MPIAADRPKTPIAIRTDLAAIFISLELSRSSWLVTSLSPGAGEKMSKHTVRSGDVAGLLERFAQLREKARGRTGNVFPLIVIQEAGLDGFWIDRVLQNEGVESHVVDPASLATSRRRRRAKTDGIDGETLIRALLAYKRGEPRVCSMVTVPTPEDEDRRRLCRERKTLTVERVQHVNRIKGLLFSQGISGYEPLRRDRRVRLDALHTGDGRPLPQHLKAQICRELDRLELLLEQIKAVEAERDALLVEKKTTGPVQPALLLAVKGIGPEFSAVLYSEGFSRHFENLTTDRCLRRPCADALAKRVSQSRARHLAIRQSPTANDDDPACLAMAASSAMLGARPLVPRSRQAQRRTLTQDDNRCTGAKAAGRALEVCDRWRHHRRRRDESCLTIGTDQSRNPQGPQKS